VMGQGPIGLLFTMLLKQRGVQRVYATDRIESRLETSRRLGIRTRIPRTSLAGEHRARHVQHA